MCSNEVLGGEDLDGTSGHQRGSDGVGADGLLSPVRALDESETIGPVQHAGLTSTPENVSRGVGDHQDVVAVGDHGVESTGQIVENECQR